MNYALKNPCYFEFHLDKSGQDIDVRRLENNLINWIFFSGGCTHFIDVLWIINRWKHILEQKFISFSGERGIYFDEFVFCIRVCYRLFSVKIVVKTVKGNRYDFSSTLKKYTNSVIII